MNQLALKKAFHQFLEESEGEVTIEQIDEPGVLSCFDSAECWGDGKFYVFTPEEKMTPQWLESRIYIQPSKTKYQLDIEKLCHYLMNHAKKDLFTSVQCIAFIYDEDGLSALYEKTGDECALDIIDLEDVVGLHWFQQDIAIVNMGLVEKLALQIAKELHSSESEELWRGVIGTLIHELRHVWTQNPLYAAQFEPEDVSENGVESYARRFMDEHSVSDIFRNEN